MIAIISSTQTTRGTPHSYFLRRRSLFTAIPTTRIAALGHVYSQILSLRQCSEVTIEENLGLASTTLISPLSTMVFSCRLVLSASAIPILAVNITIYQHNTTIAPHPLIAPNASSDGEEIVRQFTQLSKLPGLCSKAFLLSETPWNLGASSASVMVGTISLRASMTPTRKYNQTINGTDRTAGAEFGHLIVFSGTGKRIATLIQAGDLEYHNGGLDEDGTYIWVTLAQYRPNTTATLVRIDPATLEPEPLAHIADHQGGATHDLSTGTVLTPN